MRRLLTRNQFQAVLAGITVAKTSHFVLHRCQLSAPGVVCMSELHSPLKKPLFLHQSVWLGAIVPKRWAKRAVTRNAIKRQIYSLGAVGLANFSPAAFVIRLRKDFSRTQFVSASSTKLNLAVRAELQLLLQSIPRTLGTFL